MALERLLEALEARFDKPAIRGLLAAYRNHPLLWRELDLHDLPENWEDFAHEELEKWQPGFLSLAFLDQVFLKNDFHSQATDLPANLSEHSARVLETIRTTGLEPANLRDATSLAIALRQFHTESGSWQGLPDFLTAGKTSLPSWKGAFLSLPWLSDESLDALRALTTNPSGFTEKELASLLVDLIRSTPGSEKKHYEFLSKVMEGTSLSLQVSVLDELKGEFDPAFTELLANAFLLEHNGSNETKASGSSQEQIERHQNLAMLSQYAGKDTKAREELELAIDVIRNNQAVQLRRMALEFETINPEEARKLWEQVIQLEPENSDYTREYAEFLVNENETDFALDLISQKPDDGTTAMLALRYPELRERADEVTQALDNVINRKNLPSYSSRFVDESDNFRAAQYAYSQKKYSIASDFIHKALKDDPNNIESIRLAAKIDQRLANVDEAIDSSVLLAMFEPENKANNLELARLFQQTQQDDRALEVYEKVIADEQVDREDFLAYSEVAIKAGKPELAIPIAESFLAKDQLDGEALVTLSRALIASGKRSDAMALLERASAVAPEKPTSWLALARVWIELDDRDQAMLALRKAKAALPGDPRILTTLGKLYLENEETTDAIAALRQANQADPGNAETARLLADAWLKQGYLSEALETIEPFEVDFASDPELALTIGKVSLANKDANSAQRMLRFAWQSLKREDALHAYADALLRIHERHPESNAVELNQLLEAVQTGDISGRDDFDLALLYSDLKAANGFHEEAYSEYLKLLDDPRAKSPRSYHHLQSQIGKTASNLGLNDIALASLQEAMLIDPDNLETRHILAKTFLDSNLEEEAFNSARAALQIAPSDVDNILWFSAFMNERNNEKETIQVLKDAIHLRPETESLYLTLARTYAHTNEIEETKTTLNKMLTLESITTKEYIDVANLYLNLNETEEASAVILKAISNNPEPDFEETRDLVYSILRLGDAEAALKLVLNLESSVGKHPCYQILLSDVQVANRRFIPALENLNLVLQKIEFAADDECFASQRFAQTSQGFAPYSKAGFYYRLAELERVTGDLLASQKHADQAQKEDPACPVIMVLQAGLALSLQNEQKLELALNYLTPESSVSIMNEELTRILALDAAIENDMQKLRTLQEYFISKQPIGLFQAATNALLAYEGKDHEECFEALKTTREFLRSGKPEAFEIDTHFDLIWAGLMTFIAAWRAQEWSLANQAITKVFETVRINPVANQLLAAYLSDNYRQHNNAMLLHKTRHTPELFTDQDPLELLEEQIALAGRYLKPSELLPALKVGQAVFNGHWNDEEDMGKMIHDPRQAASVLSILVNPAKVDEIQDAFGSDEGVLRQRAILNFHDDPETSVSIADRLLESAPTDPDLHAIKAFASRGNPVEAADAIEKALGFLPDEPEWHVFAANMYQDAGVYDAAASHLEEALHISPKSAHYWQLLGDVKLLEKNYHAAKDYFGKASDLFPNNPEALDSLAKINQQLGEHLIAIQCWQKAYQLDPDNPAYRLSIAESHLARKEYDQAIQEADQVLFSHPANEKALWLIASAQLRSGQRNLALQTIQNAKAIAANPIPFDLLAIDIDAQAKPALALQALQSMAQNHPDDITILNQLAAYQIEAGLLDTAEINLNNSLSIDPNNAETLIALGKIDRLNGHLDQAIAHLNQAIKNDPSLIEAYLEMGQTYQERREVANAIEIYHKAIDMVEKDPRPYVQASAAYKESRDYRNAEFMLRQAAQLSPSDQSIRRQLAAIVALNLVNNLQEAPKRK